LSEVTRHIKKTKNYGKDKTSQMGMEVLCVLRKGWNANKWEDIVVKWGANVENENCLLSLLSIFNIFTI